MTLVFSLTKIAMTVPQFPFASATAARAASNMVGFRPELVRRDAGVEQDLATLLGVRAVEADHDRRPQVDAAHRLDDALGDLLAAGDAAEDVDEDGLHVLVEVDHLERPGHHVGVGAAADVEEVGRRAADLVDDVERRTWRDRRRWR